MSVEITAALRAPITDRKTAEAFMDELFRLGLDHHFDDGAVECLHGNGHITLDEAKMIDEQVRLCYDAYEAGGADLMHDCPIGYMLKISGHVMEDDDGN